MAGKRRVVIGEVQKTKDGTGTYIKIKKDTVLKQGQYLNVESKKKQLENLEAAVQNGKISAENAAKARERINKIQDFVLFEVSYMEDRIPE